MTVCDIIQKKKERRALNGEEISFFVSAVADGSATDAQIAAFCMAVLLNGMEEEECALLTLAMANSGQKTPRPQGGGVYADKHSTGGVSDSTTLILVPVLASLGVRCAKYSGRGLGHTGGTLDKLESIPGLTTALSPARFERQAEEVGAVVAGQTNETVPADKRMYAVRDTTATIDSISLIASSVMSKKLASFADVILLDVKYGRGAFMPTPEKAQELARLMVSIGTAAGRRTAAAVTCMDAPLGSAVGCNAEVREAIAVLRGEAENDLAALSLFHAALLYRMATGASKEEAETAVRGAIRSGAAFKKFAQMAEAQGGDVRALEDLSLLPLAAHRSLITAPAAGVLDIDALALGRACALLGGGRQRPGQAIDHTVGFILKKRAGERVAAGEAVAEMYYNGENGEAFSLARGAFRTAETFTPRPLIYAVTGGPNHD